MSGWLERQIQELEGKNRRLELDVRRERELANLERRRADLAEASSRRAWSFLHGTRPRRGDK